jgi:hypothetical protein
MTSPYARAKANAMLGDMYTALELKGRAPGLRSPMSH